MAKKNKTHKATMKRFKITRTGKVLHLPQGGGSGHSRNYMNSRQKKSREGKNALQATKEISKIKRLSGK